MGMARKPLLGEATMIPDWVTSLIKDVRVISPTALIGGGFVRDIINGRAVKDVDLFVHDALSVYDDIAKRIRQTHPVAGEVARDYFDWDPSITSVQLFHSDDGWPEVNLIAMPELLDVSSLFKRFDFGICQAAYDGVAVHTSEAFWKDHRDRTFTLTRCDHHHQYVRSVQRYARLSVKYPGYSLVVPEQFQHHAADAEAVWDE